MVATHEDIPKGVSLKEAPHITRGQKDLTNLLRTIQRYSESITAAP